MFYNLFVMSLNNANRDLCSAYELYMKSVADEETEKPLCDHFKNIFSRPAVRAHFVGAWYVVLSI